MDYFKERLEKWKSKIPESDSLRFEKEDALEAALGLRYSNETLNRIILAESDIQISKALTTARQTA